MRTLILGGTSFVGRAIVEAARHAGHDVTIFNRGLTGADLFPEVPRLIGDRDDSNYTALTGTSWDAVVDVSAYFPRQVQEATEALNERVGRYLFISTNAVYDRSAGQRGTDLLPPEYGAGEITGSTYGPLKVACEEVATQLWGARTTIVRPGIVAGPHDPTDRFTYWVRRTSRGGPVLLAGAPDAPVQVLDSRDLAALVIALITDDRPGIFDATGPAEPVTITELIQICARVADREVDVVTVPLEAVGPGVLPLVLVDESLAGIFRGDASAARAVGLPSTPLHTTAADVLSWDRSRGEPPLSKGLPRGREAELMAQAVTRG